jgi:hypothetical protein
MNSNTLDNDYFITYSNYFEVDNKRFAFRRKQLFDITNLPIKLDLKYNNGSKGYWINRNWFSLSKIKSIIKSEKNVVDVSNLQWYQQINLDFVFNI